MSIIPDPDELQVCPYDPVHRVAVKKFPYHLNKCRKQYGKNGEYKSCPFNARHVIPTPEYAYHIETCDSKAAIEMEIAFEQSRHDTSGVIKGCTDMPKTPQWCKPEVTENWDDDEESTPVLKPQPLQALPPDNLPRPLPQKSADSSPNKYFFATPGEKKGVRNFHRRESPRPSRGRQMSHFNRGDEHLLSSVKPNYDPSPLSDEFLDQDDFPPLGSDPQPRRSNHKPEPKLDSPLKTEYQHPPTSKHSTHQVQASNPPRNRSVFSSQPQPTTSAETPSIDQGQTPNASSFEQYPHLTQNAYTPHPHVTVEQPIQQTNSQVGPLFQNPPVYQPSLAPGNNPIPAALPNLPYPPQGQPPPVAPVPVPVPQQPFSQPPTAPNGNPSYPYSLQPTKHYPPPPHSAQQDYLNSGVHLIPQVTHTVQQTVPNTIPPQQYMYAQPQFQTVPNHQMPYTQQVYPSPPQPQYLASNQYNVPPQYAPQQYYTTVPQYNIATMPNYQQVQAVNLPPAPGQLPPIPSYQPQYTESLVGSQVSAQRPPGPSPLGEKNRALHQIPQTIPNDAYLPNSMPGKLAPQQFPPGSTQGANPPSIDQSSVVSMGSQSPGTGRGRGRGLSPRASPKGYNHAPPAANPTHQPPPSMTSLAPQMEQLHLSAPLSHMSQQQPYHSYQQMAPPVSVPQEREVAQFPPPPQQTMVQQYPSNNPGQHFLPSNYPSNPSLRSSAPAQNLPTRMSSHQIPQAAQPRPSNPKLMWLKTSIAKIELLEQKRATQPLTEEEKELLKSKRNLLEELKDM